MLFFSVLWHIYICTNIYHLRLVVLHFPPLVTTVRFLALVGGEIFPKEKEKSVLQLQFYTNFSSTKINSELVIVHNVLTSG